jgi:putative ABC transport system permease protein
MLKHNLLLMYRNFNRSRVTFFINLAGLSVGLAAALLIYLWVTDELGVDKFHEKDSRLFQVMMNIDRPDGIETSDFTPGLMAKALLEEVPEIENAVGVVSPPSQVKGILSFGDKYIRANEHYAEKEFFNIFSYRLLQGSKDKVLSDKNNILISDNLAIKLFGTIENVAGKSVEWNRRQFSGTYMISGIFEHIPENSTAQFDVLFSFDLFMEKNPDWLEWGNSSSIAYVVLKDGMSVTKLNRKISGFIKSKHAGSKNTVFLRPYSDQYLYNTYENGVLTGGRIAYVKLFSIIAFFILVIACINFMNLSTAKASRRIKEIGIKKAMGAGRKALIFQYLEESLLMAFLSLAIAVLIVDIILPQFNSITGKHLALSFDKRMLPTFCSIAFFTGVISGSYPALYLSGFNPAVVLKGRLQRSVGELWTRKGLVVFQFAISVILIVSVVVVYRQLGFIQSKNLGYNKDNVIYFANEGRLREGLEPFLAGIRSIPGVVNASDFSFDLAGEHGSTYGLEWEGKKADDNIDFANLEADFDMIEVLGLELTEGRSFSREFGNESSNVILNQAAVAVIGFREPVGKIIKIWGKERQIIGVVRNFHFQSLYENVKPCFIQCVPNKRNVLVRIKAGMEQETLSRLQKFYHEYNLGLPFEYKFLDDDYQKLYTAEKRVATLSGYFAGIAITISCLGLFGLAAFTAERRLKEIGIRKVLGSDELGIVLLLSADFTRIVLAAVIIALPLSYFIAKNWLDSFAFRIPLEWWYFTGAGAAALLIAWLTVGVQAIRAATVNPAKCLRDE